MLLPHEFDVVVEDYVDVVDVVVVALIMPIRHQLMMVLMMVLLLRIDRGRTGLPVVVGRA